MPKFMMIYHGGGRPDSPEEGEKVMAAWMAWMGGIGENLVDGGNPAGMSKTVTATGVEDNGGANPVSGYTLINAADMDAAIEIAKGCPILEGGQGTVEIAEAMEM
ncbi:YciI family protein [Thiosulfatihalobacter marinus]|uniref:YciI family protein n=1 Tax=Thiosulfatihalobacter marinus TaxID=2792481 RepID=UPI0018D690AE|nr:YciI family protein [Thiosulfatihalobacter marinus]